MDPNVPFLLPPIVRRRPVRIAHGQSVLVHGPCWPPEPRWIGASAATPFHAQFVSWLWLEQSRYGQQPDELHARCAQTGQRCNLRVILLDFASRIVTTRSVFQSGGESDQVEDFPYCFLSIDAAAADTKSSVTVLSPRTKACSACSPCLHPISTRVRYYITQAHCSIAPSTPLERTLLEQDKDKSLTKCRILAGVCYFIIFLFEFFKDSLDGNTD